MSTFYFKVAIREFERGWGPKVIDIVQFDSYDEAVAEINRTNSKNTAPTAPDYYIQAEALNFNVSE